MTLKAAGVGLRHAQLKAEVLTIFWFAEVHLVLTSSLLFSCMVPYYILIFEECEELDFDLGSAQFLSHLN